MGKRIFSVQANNSAMTEFDPAMTGPIAASVARGHEQTTEAMPPADPNRPSGVAATIGVTLKRVPRGYFHEKSRYTTLPALVQSELASTVRDHFKGFPLERR